MTVEKMLDELVGKEGAYSNHASDRGGETMWGVTIAVARAFGYAGMMAELPQATAREIYRTRYWTHPRFNEVAAIDLPLGEQLFDIGVNMGQGQAGKFLQRALNVLNRQAKDYPDITADGAIGNMTLAAMNSYIDKRGADGRAVLRQMVNSQNSVRRIEIAERDVQQEDFQHGWQFNRVRGIV
jgi:lysozyme family protein